MADLGLRIGRDVLVVADNTRSSLQNRGFDEELINPYILEVEPECYEDALRLDAMGGSQCIVINFFSYLPTDLRASNSLCRAQSLAKENVKLASKFKLQHPLIKITPSGLPLDPSSKNSLQENCDEYKFVAMLFEELAIDGFYLSDFDNLAALKCALTGLRMISDLPIICDIHKIGQHDLVEADYGDCVFVPKVIDCEQFDNVDENIDFAIELAHKGNQFLIIKNGTSAICAAVAAMTNSIMLD